MANALLLGQASRLGDVQGVGVLADARAQGQNMAAQRQQMGQQNALFQQQQQDRQREMQMRQQEEQIAPLREDYARFMGLPDDNARNQAWQSGLAQHYGQDPNSDWRPAIQQLTQRPGFLPKELVGEVMKRHFAPKPQGLTNVAPGGVVFDQDARRPVYTAPRAPEADKAPPGYRLAAGGLEAIPGGPADPKNPLNANKGGNKTPLSAAGQKELFEADEVVSAAGSAVDILKSIITKDPETGLSQNDVAYEGGTAGLRSGVMGFVPGQYEGENASVDLGNKVTGQALQSLKVIFGGMPTEGERKILIELQGSLSQKASQREAIFKRAIEMAEKRLKFAQEKAKSLRAGTYFGSDSPMGNEQDVMDAADAILNGAP